MKQFVAAFLFAALIIVPTIADAKHRHHRYVSHDANGNGTTIVGGRPSECYKFPKTAGLYCGCASALYVGLDNRNGYWNLASHWLTLPSAAPGPGMAVVRHGHVAIIIGGSPGAWQLYDPNSGRGLTRIWTRPLFGKTVNPHGEKMASNRRSPAIH